MGSPGGACLADRSCTDIAGAAEGDAATPQCCGVGTPAEGEGDAITDYCGDGLGTITATTGFSRGGVEYAHACSAFKMIASSASALAVAYLM